MPIAAEQPYLEPPEVVEPPREEHALETRRFQGIPSLAVSPKGRVWVTWYAGPTPGEDRNNYVVLAARDEPARDGSEPAWREQLVVDPDGEGPVRAFDPQLWRSPDGRLWLFWAQGYEKQKTTSSRSGVWAITAEDPDAERVEWSEPRRLCDGVMMGKPLVLGDGAWALPVSFWHRREAGSAGVVVSEDRGETWRERGAADVPPELRDHDEHMIVERRDGSLWMWVRIRSGIAHSVSEDGGRTWSAVTPSDIPHVRSRFFIRRLDSGNLLLVRHDPADADFATVDNRGTRSHLIAQLSEDDGETWIGQLLLDERKGVSYPDGQQAADGTICITYDRDRKGDREVLLATFTEADVRAGEATSPKASLRETVSRHPDAEQ